MSQQDPSGANGADGANNAGQNPYGQPISQPPPSGQYPPQQPPQAPGYPPLPPGQQVQGYPQYAPTPPQPLSPSDERMWGMLAYLFGILFGFLAPLIIFLVYKDRSHFVRETSREALNLQITGAIVSIAATFGIVVFGTIVTVVAPPIGILMFVIGFVILFAYLIALLVFEIIGAVRANSGVVYRVPYILRLVK